MLIFVYEYTCAVPFGPDLPASLRAEGLAMLSAALADFAGVDGVRVCTLLADDFAAELPYPSRRTAGAEQAAFLRLAREADYTLVIAPEFDDLLATRCQWVEQAAGRSLNCTIPAIRLTADKLALAEHLHQHRVPTPPTQYIASTVTQRSDGSMAFPAVCKPRFGAGSQATFLVHHPEELPECLARANAEGTAGGMILQPFLPGQPASVAFLLGPGANLPLWPAAQYLSADGRFRYRGGSAPLPESLWPRAIALANRAVACVPGLRGYVGLDLVLGVAPDGSADAVIEINPRLTTSYIGLRHLAPFHLAQALLHLMGADVPAPFPLGFPPLPPGKQVVWTSDGKVMG